MGGLAGFGDHDFIANEQVDIPWAVHMLTEEHPKEHRPGNHCGEKALYSAITAPCARPAGDSEHGDAPRHRQHGQCDPLQLAARRRRHLGLQALEKCYNVHRGLLRRLRVEVVVDYNSTTALRQKPFHVSAFWRRYWN